MRIVEPWIKVEKIDGKKIMKRLERACRTCYRSEGKINVLTFKNISNLIFFDKKFFIIDSKK